MTRGLTTSPPTGPLDGSGRRLPPELAPSRSQHGPTVERWIRWLDAPDHLVALLDRTSDTTLDVNQDAVAAGEAERRTAPGVVRGVGGAVRVRVEEMTTARPLSFFPSGDHIENRHGGKTT